jgi:hypothetical protein
MRALILKDEGTRGPALHGLGTLLEKTLSNEGWNSDAADVAELRPAACTGCFTCWLRTPGICAIPDSGRELTRRAVQADALIYLSPLSFGGPSAALQRSVERCVLPHISPLFQRHRGEMHHLLRYPKALGLAVLAWQENEDPEAADVLIRLSERWSRNLHGKAATEVFHGNPDAAWPARVSGLVRALGAQL